jgi:peptide/nickel transport system permease protein
MRRSARYLLSSRAFVVGTIIVCGFIFVAMAAPLIAPPEGDDPYQLPQDGYVGNPEPPSPGHLLGLLQDRYDVFYGIIWGTRVAFRIGLVITLGRVLIGSTVGVVSGYYGGWLDAVVMRITDAFMSFPVVAAVMIILALFVEDSWGIQMGQGGPAIVVALILFGWMQYARVIRGNVLAEKSQDYVKAAISLGAPNKRIIFRHILPNALQGLLVLAASDVGAMVVTVTALTFLGLSGDKPVADWGIVLKYSRNWIVGTPVNAFEYWYTYIPPIIVIVLFSLGWGLIGDGLRVALDPRLRGTQLG